MQLCEAVAEKIKSKWSGTQGAVSLENTPAHKSMAAMTAVLDCGFKLVNYLPYYPDLAAHCNHSLVCRSIFLMKQHPGFCFLFMKL